MRKKQIVLASLLIGLVFLFSPWASRAEAVDQWATSVIGYSSQWSSGSWSAAQALGEPNTFGYGDIGTSWAPGPINGTLEYITLGYATPVYAEGALIRETYGNGFVYQVDAVDTGNNYHTVWAGIDPSLPGSPIDFTITWATTPYLAKGLKIYVNTNHDLSAWEEIDAVRLSGTHTAPVPITGALLLFGPGLAALAAIRKKLNR